MAGPDPRHAVPCEDTLLQPVKVELPRRPHHPRSGPGNLQPGRQCPAEPGLGRHWGECPSAAPGRALERPASGSAGGLLCMKGVIYGGSLEREKHLLSGTLAAPAGEPLPQGPQAVGTPCLTRPRPWGCSASLPTPQPSPNPGSSGSLQISRPNPTEGGRGAGDGRLCAVTTTTPSPQVPWTRCEPTCLGRRRPRPHPRRKHRPRWLTRRRCWASPQGPTPRTTSWASGHQHKG